MKEIQLKDAKATLSAVIDQAVRGHPAVITRYCRKEAVVLSFDEHEGASTRARWLGEWWDNIEYL